LKLENKISKGVACSIFRKEIEYLTELGKLNLEFSYLDSELHMQPRLLKQKIAKYSNSDCLHCFGDCHQFIAEQAMAGEISKVKGMNCVEIFLGKKDYHRLRAEGSFFLLPEWTLKWERIFKELLGFGEKELAAEFMNEMHSKLVYIDTAVYEIPYSTLNDISDYFNLPLEILHINLSQLEKTIKNELKDFENEK